MSEVNLFNWLVEYHVRYNLPECLSYFKEGRVHNTKGIPFREGGGENKHYTGILIVANGSTLFDRLYEDEIILDKEMDPSATIPTKELFFDYLRRQQDPTSDANTDGAYVFNGETGEITRVYELNNNPDSLPEGLRLENMLPQDFTHQDGRGILRANLGLKTRLAIKLPQAYANCGALQIKCSPYSSLGLGKVTHFERAGLVEEFFLQYAPESSGPFVDEEHQIVGMLRKYENLGGRVVRVGEELWTPDYQRRASSCGLEKCVDC